MDVRSAFNNVSRVHLERHMEALEVESGLVKWNSSFISDRQVKLVLDGEEGKRTQGTPAFQGSPAAPALFITYLSGIFDEVERAVLGFRANLVDDIGWWADGKGNEAVAAKAVQSSSIH